MSEPIRFTVDSKDMSIKELCDLIDRGRIRLPKYQREFVWNTEQVCSLWDSIVKNISLGSVTLWETFNRLDDDKSIGGLILQPVDKSVELRYALDGQQRITSIYGAYKGLTIGKIDFKKFYVDVSKDPTTYFPESSIHYIEDFSAVSNKNDYFNSNYLLTTDFKELLKLGVLPGVLGVLSSYDSYFTAFKLTTIITVGDNRNIARELFVRTNNTGKTLNPYEILCAAIYSEDDNFYFSDRVSEFLQKFESFGFKKSTSSENEFLKSLSVIYCNNYTTKSVLDINVDDIITDWGKLIEAYSRMVDFVKENLNVVTINSVQSKIIYALLVKYFFLYPSRLTHNQTKLLVQLYWYLNLTPWIRSNWHITIPKVNTWLTDINNEKTPDYDYSILYSKDTIMSVSHFSGKNGSISQKERSVMLTYLESLHPKSFYNSSEVKRENLAEKNKPNLHHLFAQSVWKDKSNQIGNMSILDAQTNKIISNRKPSEYLPEFKLTETILETHCIDQTAYSYLLADDFDKFTTYRIGKIYDNLVKLAKGL